MIRQRLKLSIYCALAAFAITSLIGCGGIVSGEPQSDEIVEIDLGLKAFTLDADIAPNFVFAFCLNLIQITYEIDSVEGTINLDDLASLVNVSSGGTDLGRSVTLENSVVFTQIRFRFANNCATDFSVFLTDSDGAQQTDSGLVYTFSAAQLERISSSRLEIDVQAFVDELIGSDDVEDSFETDGD